MRKFRLDDNTTSLKGWHDEIEVMRDVLLGRTAPPIDNGVISLMEVADAYLARAREIEQIILREEAEGAVLKGTRTNKFRTGELRSFIELCKGASELGSRRVTVWRTEIELDE